MKFLRIFLLLLVVVLLFSVCSTLFKQSYDETLNDSNTIEESIKGEDDSNTIKEPTKDEDVFSTYKYLAFGDSVTAGSGLESRSKSYPNTAGNLLGINTVNNKAVGGSSFVRDPANATRRCIAEDVVSFCSSSAIKYDVISVAGGVNDQAKSFPIGSINDSSTETIYGSLNIICETLLEKYPDAFIFLITPIKQPTSETPNKEGYTLSVVRDAICAIGEKYDLPVLDLYNTSGFETDEYGMNHPDCDGWHPLQEFVDNVMAPQVANFIVENYNRKK